MARNRKTRKRRSKSSGLGSIFAIFGAILVLTALIGAGAYLAINTEDEVALDENLCPTEGARGTIAILLDTTDELAQVTKTEIKSKILEIQSTLPRFYRTTVYTLDEDGLKREPLASICNPGRLDQMDSLAREGLTANPAMIQRKYNEFENTISNAIAQVFQKQFEAAQSPLLSSMQELSSLLTTPIEIDAEKYKAGRNEIIFVSDFLEHTDVFSNYRTGIDINSFKNSRATEKFGRSYQDTDINVLMVRRNKNDFSTLELANFWATVFKQEFNSDIKSLQILPGEI